MPDESHAARWKTVSVLVPILVLFFLFAPPIALFVLVAIFQGIALWEYFSLFCGAKSVLDYGFLLSLFLGTCLLWAAQTGEFSLMFIVLWMGVFAFASRAMIRFNQGKEGFEQVVKETLSLLWIPCMVSAILLLRVGENGITWLFFVMFLAFISDTGAYYAGSTWGKHKLIPTLSPGKTVEGALGSIGADILVVTIFKLTLLPELTWPMALALAVCAAVATQLGDLFESMVKRTFQVKDSGGIFPGHGGVLDRIDGLLFTAPVVYCFQLLVSLG